MLKSHFLKMYSRPMAEIVKVVKCFSYTSLHSYTSLLQKPEPPPPPHPPTHPLSSLTVIRLPLHLKFSVTKNVLQGLNTENITRTPSACSCKTSEFCYNPAGHIITGDLSIVSNRKLRDILSKGLKYRERRCFFFFFFFFFLFCFFFGNRILN